MRLELVSETFERMNGCSFQMRSSGEEATHRIAHGHFLGTPQSARSAARAAEGIAALKVAALSDDAATRSLVRRK
jgi:hypothetical protein